MDRFQSLAGHSRQKREKKSKPPVPPREWMLVFILLLNVAWLTFALGGVRLWGLFPALALSLCSLLLLPLWPRGEYPGSPKPVFRLLACPLFWLGFGLYVFMFIQSWNLAWDWTLAPDARPMLVAVKPVISWLPTGISSPLDESNPIRSMVFYTIPWVSCSTAWVGLQSRRSVGLLLHGLAWLCLFFAGIALYQFFLDKDLILGIFPTVSTKIYRDIPFWGTLINENHAAFYLVLGTGLSLGLFLSGWHKDLGQYRRKGGSWMLYLGISLVTTYAVLMAQARGAMLCVSGLWILFLLVCSFFFVRRYGRAGAILPLGFLVMATFLALGFIINPKVFERQRAEWLSAYDLIKNPQLESRYYMMHISLDMIEAHPWVGQGAGSFRYLHLPQLANYPEFKTQYYAWQTNRYSGKPEKVKRTIWFQNAHVDLLEYLIEWGIIGCLLPMGAMAWLLYRAWHSRLASDPGRLIILLTILVVLLGASFEFHLRIPLVALSWSLAFTGTVRLSELDSVKKIECN